MIRHEEIVKLLRTYFPNSELETLHHLADDIIVEIIPMLYETVQKKVMEQENNQINR